MIVEKGEEEGGWWSDKRMGNAKKVGPILGTPNRYRARGSSSVGSCTTRSVRGAREKKNVRVVGLGTGEGGVRDPRGSMYSIHLSTHSTSQLRLRHSGERLQGN